MNQTEQTVQFLLKEGVRVAFFDEKGDLYTMKKATISDRKQLFTNGELNAADQPV